MADDTQDGDEESTVSNVPPAPAPASGTENNVRGEDELPRAQVNPAQKKEEEPSLLSFIMALIEAFFKPYLENKSGQSASAPARENPKPDTLSALSALLGGIGNYLKEHDSLPPGDQASLGEIARRLPAEGNLPEGMASPLADVFNQLASNHFDPQATQRDCAAFAVALQKGMVEGEMKVILRSFDGHTATAQEKQELQSRMDALEHSGAVQKGMMTQEALEAFKDISLQSGGILPHDQEKFKEDLRVLGGEQAVGAYENLARLKSGNAPADQVRQATEALRGILAKHPNILLSMQHQGNGDMVALQPASVLQPPARGDEEVTLH